MRASRFAAAAAAAACATAAGAGAMHVAPAHGGAECGPPQHGVILGTNHNIGGPIANISTSQECCELCGATDGCMAYNLHTNPATPQYEQCNLHSSAADPANSSDSVAGTVSGSSGCRTHSGGFWTTSLDIASLTVSSAAGCCVACRANPKCVTFAYHTDGSQACWLHGDITGFSATGAVIGGVPSGDIPPVPAVPGEYVEGFACRDPDAVARYKFCDPSLSLEERLDDLVPRITDQEAGPQLTARQSPNVSRIGLPSYYWCGGGAPRSYVFTLLRVIAVVVVVVCGGLRSARGAVRFARARVLRCSPRRPSRVAINSMLFNTTCSQLLRCSC